MSTAREKLLVAWYLTLAMGLSSTVLADSVYETREQFLTRAFGSAHPQSRVVWFSGATKMEVKRLLGHDYATLRLRYWCREGRSAWILDEIGKELPITVGVIIDQDHIQSLRVLVYRENRGGEVVAPAFTEQFDGMTQGSDNQLDSTIDGISGATLSVNALTRLAGLALYLHKETGCKNGA
jgi:hypothetical protein